jgi:hypothetical protein
MPEFTLVLSLQRRYRTTDLKLFHTVLTARFWHCVTSTCVSQESSQRNLFVMRWRSSNCYGKNGKECRKSWRVIQWLVLNCSALASLYRTRGSLCEKWDIEAKYMFWFIFCVLFHFCFLSGRTDRNMKTLLCRGTVDCFPAVVRLDLRHTEPLIRYLPRAFLRGNATVMDSLPLTSN